MPPSCILSFFLTHYWNFAALNGTHHGRLGERREVGEGRRRFSSLRCIFLEGVLGTSLPAHEGLRAGEGPINQVAPILLLERLPSLVAGSVA